jgi:hypothetical protein
MVDARGESIHDISRAIGKFLASVFGVLKAHGAFPPPLRRRSSSALTLAGARGDLSWPGGRALDAPDCQSATAHAIDNQP